MYTDLGTALIVAYRISVRRACRIIGLQRVS